MYICSGSLTELFYLCSQGLTPEVPISTNFNQKTFGNIGHPPVVPIPDLNVKYRKFIVRSENMRNVVAFQNVKIFSQISNFVVFKYKKYVSYYIALTLTVCSVEHVK